MIVEGECLGIEFGDNVLVEGQVVGKVVKVIYFLVLQCFIVLVLIDNEYVWFDISGFVI